jgi:23S rRNA pseudouridine1911/1915/1917 synthase
VRERIWIVRHGDGATVEAIVARAGGDASAVAEGRVFIGRRRARPNEAVAAGDEVRVVSPSGPASELRVLAFERGVLAVDKPAGLSTIPDESGAAGSLLDLAARTAGVTRESLHATSRLDRQVSGVVVFTTTAAARKRLQDARESGEYFRRYVALATHAPSPPSGEWSFPIGRAGNPKLRKVAGRDAVPARTRYQVLAETPAAALLSLQPITGRTHQLRVHCAHAGAPLLGDRDYGGPRSLVLPSGKVVPLDRIALHCSHVRVDALDLVSPIPDALEAWWTAAGGVPAAWLAIP